MSSLPVRQLPHGATIRDDEVARLRQVLREHEARHQTIVVEVTTMSAVRDRLASIDLAAYVRDAFNGLLCDEMDGVTSIDAAEAVLANGIRAHIHRPLTQRERAELGMQVALEWNSRRPAPPEPFCPRCGAHMKDNRATKRFPNGPDWVCRLHGCHGAIYPKHTTTTEKQGT